MRRILLIVAGVIFATLPSVVSAGPVCVAGPVASITNTGCSIGSLTFDFQDMRKAFYPYYGSTGTTDWVEQSIDNWNFTPVTNGLSYGFTISGDTLSTGVPPPDSYVVNFASLYYNVTSTSGLPIIVGTSVTGGAVSLTGTGGAAYGIGAESWLTFTSGLSVDNGGPKPLSSSFAPESGTLFRGTFLVGYVYSDVRGGGDYLVDWRGASTMLFETQAVPDAGSTLLLLGMGLAGLAAWRRRWQ